MNNERVQQLAERAGIEWDDKYHYFVSAATMRLFAQSVAQECADICDDYGMPDGTSQTAMILSAVIKSKFGVKE